MVSYLRPHVTAAMLTADMNESYGLTVSEIKELQSYDDAMFLIKTNGMSVIVISFASASCCGLLNS
jgi:hypothetical protein